jgi:hypothetical protein
MRHRHLDAENIRTLVTESRVVENTDTLMMAFLEKVETLVNERFRSHRRLTGPQLRAIYDECMDMVAKDLVVLDGVFTEVPPTRTRPKGEVYEMRFVSFMRMQNPPPGDAILYQLFSFRLKLSRRSVSLDFQWHPVAFSYHATERLVERSSEKAAAMRRIATELAGSLELIACADAISIKSGLPNFHTPFADASGALLGEFVPYSPPKTKSTAFKRSCAHDHVIGNPDQRLYIARTFVDRYQLEPVQSYAMNLLSLWREEGGDGYTAQNERRCWTEGDGLAVMTPFVERTGCVRMLELVFADPSFKRAHCRGRPEDTQANDFLLPMGRWREQHHVPDDHPEDFEFVPEQTASPVFCAA